MITKKSIEDAFDTFYRSHEKTYLDLDVPTIQDVIKKKFNVDLTNSECRTLWHWYSEEFYAASWLSVSRSEIIHAFETFMIRYGSIGINNNEKEGIFKVQEKTSNS